MENSNIKFGEDSLVMGVRVKNGSVKIFQRGDGQYMVVVSKYLWKFRVSNKSILTKNFEEAEDYVISAKYHGEIKKDLKFI